MKEFKLYKDVLTKYWDRYFYEIKAENIEEAVEKVKNDEIDGDYVEQLSEITDGIDPLDNNGKPTEEIYSNGELLWDNAKLVNREEIITHDIRSITENLSLIMKGEPESFIGGDIALSTITKVMKGLGWEIDRFETNGWEIDYWIYFIKDNKDFSYKVSGCILDGEVKIEKYHELQD